MIAVIADDFTGAAELGGIGLRHRLVTEVSTVVPEACVADLLVIAADTRSKDEAAAVEDMLQITSQLKRLKPDWIYKKTDSVLRGHVVAELMAHLEVMGLQRVLLVPANPALGRTVVDGNYFFNDRPVHESAFAVDPEFPVTSSAIQDMLRSPAAQVRKIAEELPAEGIVVGEARETEDLLAWAGRVKEGMAGSGRGRGRGRGGALVAGAGSGGTLVAGASGFFSAMLDVMKLDGNRVSGGSEQGYPLLYISGTTFTESRERIRLLSEEGGPVIYMPSLPDARWIEETADLLLDRGKAIVAIGAADLGEVSALQLRTTMAEAISQLLEKVTVGELFIEGGSTAYAILHQAGLHQFIPEEELAPGVIRMSVPVVPGLHLTVKPGSYRWPESIRF